jgi:hypothetical protein
MLGTMQVEGTDLCVVNLGALRIYAKCIQPPCSACTTCIVLVQVLMCGVFS